MKRRNARKWFAGLTGFVLLTLLSLQFLFFFFGDEILKKSILVAFSQYVTHQYPNAKTQPSLDFKNLRLNLFSGDLTITEVEFESGQIVAYEEPGSASKVFVQELQVDGIDLWEIYRLNELNLDNIHLKAPTIRLVKKNTLDSTQRKVNEWVKVSTDKLHETVQEYFNALSFKKLYVEDAKVSVYLIDSLKRPTDAFSPASSHYYASHLHLTLIDFLLDSTTQNDMNRILFAKDIEARISDYKILLPDSSYLFRADTLVFSTIDQKLYLTQVEVVPEKATQSNADQYFRMQIPLVELTQIDLHKIYFDSLLQIHELTIQQPYIQIYGNFDRKNSVQISSLGLRELHPDSLYSLTSQKLTQLSVNYFKLRDGRLNVYDIQNDSAELLHVESLHLGFNDFLLDGSTERTSVDSLSNVLPMDSILLELADVKISMPDKIHSLTSEFVSLTTDRQRRYQCDLLFDSVHIKPETDSLSGLFGVSESSVGLGYDISIEQMVLYDIDLEDLSRRKLVFIDSMSFFKPRIDIANFSSIPFGELADENRDTIEDKSIKEILYNWSQARLDFHPIIAPGRNTALFYGIYVDHIHIDSGKIHLKKADYTDQTFDHVASLENFSAYVRQARVDNMGGGVQAMRRGYRDSKVAVHANDLDIFLQNGAFRLPNDGGPTSDGTLQFTSAAISTANSEGYVKGLYIWPNRLVTASSRNQIRQIFLPYIGLSGFDFDRLYNQQQAIIRNLYINSPQVNLAIDEKQNARKAGPSEITMQNLFQWINPYLNAIDLQQLDVRNASVAVERRSMQQKGFHDFITAETLNLKVEGFFLDSATQITRKKPLYANSALLEAKNYKINFTTDTLRDFVSIKGKTLAFSTHSNQLQISRLNISSLRDSVRQQYNFQIDEVKLDYANLYDYLKYDQLLLNQLSIRYPKGKIVSKHTARKEPVVAEKTESLQPNLYVYIQDFVTKLKVDYLSLEQGAIEYITLNQDTTHYIRADTVSLSATNVLIDPLIRREHKMWYADQVDFDFYISRYFLKMQESQQQLRASNIVLSYADAQVKAEQVELQPLIDTAQTIRLSENSRNNLYNIRVPSVVMNGVAFEKAFLQGDWAIEELAFTHPQIHIFHHPSSAKKTKSYREIAGNYINSIRIDQIAVKEGKLKLAHSSGDSSNSVSAERIDAYLYEFYMDQQVYHKITEKNSKISNATRRLLFADELVVKAKDYQHKLSDSLLIVKADEIGLSTKKSSLSITSFELVPRYGKYEIKNYFPHQKTWADCRIPVIEVQDIDFEKMVTEGAFKADLVNVMSPHLMLFKDKRLPRNLSLVRPMPQDVLMKLNFPVTIDSVKVFDGFISYEERMPEADRNGKVTFEKLNACLSHMTNDPKLVESNALMSVEANAYLMGKGFMEVALNFHLGSPDRMFSASGSLEPMDLTQLNAMLEPVAFLHISRGFSKGMNFQFVGNKERSSGAMRFNYHDLHVLLVDKQKGVPGLGERVGSFLANTFVLKADNPTAASLRIGKIAYEREEEQSIFHFLWQSLLSGIKSSIGVEKHADKTKNFTLVED